MNRSQRLFIDWLSVQNKKVQQNIIESLKNEKAVFAYKSLLESMGEDGKTLRTLFTESNLNEDSKKAKEIFCSQLLEAVEEKKPLEDYITGGLNQEGYEHYAVLSPTDGIGNNIISDIELTQNGLVTQILRAIVGGNMAIAAQLTSSGWNTLTPGDKMAIFNTATVQSGYNQSKLVAKDNGEARYYAKQVKESLKDGSIKKEDFITKIFPKTDISLLKI